MPAAGIDINGMKAIEAIHPAMERWFSDNGWSNSRIITYDHQGRSPSIHLFFTSEAIGCQVCLVAGRNVMQCQSSTGVGYTGVERELACARPA